MQEMLEKINYVGTLEKSCSLPTVPNVHGCKVTNFTDKTMQFSIRITFKILGFEFEKFP